MVGQAIDGTMQLALRSIDSEHKPVLTYNVSDIILAGHANKN